MEFRKPTKLHPQPHIKIGNFYMKDASNEKYPNMVNIYKTPAWGKALLNKSYLTPQHAYKMIDVLDTENKLKRLQPKVNKDLLSLGLDIDLD
jgi:hypothetical protein